LRHKKIIDKLGNIFYLKQYLYFKMEKALLAIGLLVLLGGAIYMAHEK